MHLPNIIGLEINKAFDTIKPFINLYNIRIIKTMSPFNKKSMQTSQCRVVRQRIFDNTIEIIISYF